jgi:FkbM family methyltransferase
MILTSKFKALLKLIAIKLSGSLPDRIYFDLYKRYNLIKKIDLAYSCENGFVWVESKKDNLVWCTNRSRANYYNSGLLERGRSIGKSYLLDYIDFNSEDLIVDCGANMGDLQLYFHQKDMKIRYLGIEPNPADFKCLERNLLDGAKALNIGLWNSESIMDFYVDKFSSSSSLIEPPKYSKIISVITKRLDQLQLGSNIKLLKVEGEGAEPEIIEGCANSLANVEYVTIDVGPERGVEQSPTRNSVIRLMKKYNYSIVKENPWHRKTILFRNKLFRPII